MADEDDTGSEGEGEETPPEKTFTQAQLDKIVGRKKNAGMKEALKLLGLPEDIDEAKAKLAEINGEKEEAETTAKTGEDVSKHLLRAQEKERKAGEKAAAATRRLNEVNVITALRLEGVDPGAAELIAPALKVDLQDEDLDDEDIAEAIEVLKGKMPKLFEKDDGTPPPPKIPGSTTRGKPPAPPTGSTLGERGRALFEQRHPQAVKS